MKRVHETIQLHQRRFAKLPLFALLEGPGTVDDIRTIARGMGMFALSFPDMLRLIASRMTDPKLRALAEQRCRECASHDRWFLHDLDVLGIDTGPQWLFGAEHRPTRNTTDEVMFEIRAARSDGVRLAIAQALETTFRGFIEHNRFFERVPFEGYLAFFSGPPRDVEYPGGRGDNATARAFVDVIELDAVALEEARGAVARVVRALTRMLQSIHRQVLTQRVATEQRLAAEQLQQQLELERRAS